MIPSLAAEVEYKDLPVLNKFGFCQFKNLDGACVILSYAPSMPGFMGFVYDKGGPTPNLEFDHCKNGWKLRVPVAVRISKDGAK